MEEKNQEIIKRLEHSLAGMQEQYKLARAEIERLQNSTHEHQLQGIVFSKLRVHLFLRTIVFKDFVCMYRLVYFSKSMLRAHHLRLGLGLG